MYTCNMGTVASVNHHLRYPTSCGYYMMAICIFFYSLWLKSDKEEN